MKPAKWGGKRLGAGRKQTGRTVRIWPLVKPTTKTVLTQMAFDTVTTIGAVIDTLVDAVPKKVVDAPKKKK